MKVLIAEDEALARRLLQNYLERWGHEVVAAQNGAEAWQLFAAGEFSIVISDWIMPELDGVELIRRIRACRVRTRLLARPQRRTRFRGRNAADGGGERPAGRRSGSHD